MTLHKREIPMIDIEHDKWLRFEWVHWSKKVILLIRYYYYTTQLQWNKKKINMEWIYGYGLGRLTNNKLAYLGSE